MQDGRQIIKSWIKAQPRSEELRVALRRWQASHRYLRECLQRMRNGELKVGEEDNDEEDEQAIRVITDSFRDIPQGAVLYHATKDKNWEYKSDQWLATSYSKSGALSACSNGSIIEFTVSSCDVRGVWVGWVPGHYESEKEVLLDAGLSVEWRKLS